MYTLYICLDQFTPVFFIFGRYFQNLAENWLLPPSQFIGLARNLGKSQKLGLYPALINANESPP
jgi:hypothetical protein